jgi:hypothetical protein
MVSLVREILAPRVGAGPLRVIVMVGLLPTCACEGVMLSDVIDGYGTLLPDVFCWPQVGYEAAGVPAMFAVEAGWGLRTFQYPPERTASPPQLHGMYDAGTKMLFAPAGFTMR